MWYGKAPGVGRCGDVFKHMRHAGTAAKGGVLLVAGDDHGAYSSTLPNQSDHLFAASMIPFLYPHSVEEYLDLGLHGFAMSRFAGLPVGFKALADTVESSGSIAADNLRIETLLPEDVAFPPDGVHARLSTDTGRSRYRELPTSSLLKACSALRWWQKIHRAGTTARCSRRSVRTSLSRCTTATRWTRSSASCATLRVCRC